MFKRGVRFEVVLAALLVALGSFGCSQRDKKQLPGPDADVESDIGDISSDADLDVEQPDGDTTPDMEVTPDVELPGSMVVCVSTKVGCLAAPEDGSALELELNTHDVDSSALGLQVRFNVTLENVPTGTRVELLRDGALVSNMNAPSETFDLANTTLTHATAPSCPVYTVRIPDEGLEQAFTLCANTGGCAPKLAPSSPLCQETDANPATPGFQMEFTVTSLMPGCDLAWLSWGEESIAPRPLGNGSAVIQVTLWQTATPTCQEVDVVAHVSDSNNPEREETTNAVFNLTATVPVLEISSPTASTLNAQVDEDSDLGNGLDILLEGTVDQVHGDATVVLWVQRPGSSQFVQESTAPALGGTFVFPVKMTETGPYQFKVQVADCCGHVAEDTYSTVAILDTADLRVLSPYDGTVLRAKENGPAGSDTVYDLPFVVQAPGVGSGQTLELECRPNPPGSAWTVVGSVTPTTQNEDYILVVPVLLDTAVFGNEAVCRARFVDGDKVTQSAYVQVEIGLPPPQLRIGDPTEGQLVDPGDWVVSGFSKAKAWKGLTFQVLSGASVEAEGELQVDLGLAAESGFLGTLTPGALFDGSYTLVVEGEDVFGNLASEQAGNVTSVEVNVDSLPPEITPLFPFVPFSVCTPPTCVDSVALRAGHQVDVRVKISGEARPDLTEVCLSANGGSPVCSMALANVASWEAAFYGVTLLPGDNQLKATAEDGLGHTSELIWTVTLSKLAPRVELRQPPQDLVTGDSTPTVQAAVLNPSTLAPIPDAAVALMVNGSPIGTATYIGDGIYEAEVSGLLADVPAEVQVSAAHTDYPDNVGYSDIRRITYKSLAPTIQLKTLPNGALINLAFVGCAPGVPGCTLDIEAVTTNVEEGQKALLVGDCLASPISAVVNANKMVFKKVALPDNTTCTLEASVVDAAGQSASSGEIEVTVDRTGPRICKFDAPSVGILPAEWDENLALDGFQYTIRVGADRLEAGQVLTLTISGPNGAQQVIPLPVASAVVGSTCSVFTFPQATLEFGLNTLTVTTVDDAENSASLSRVTEFSETSTLAEFFITSYVAPNACTSSSTCGQGVCAPVSGGQKCVLGWKASSQALASQTFPVSLFSGFGALRLCSDHPGLGGETCAYTAEGTFRVVKTFDSVGGFQNMELTKTQVMALPQGMHHMVLEAKRADTGVWLSSLQSPKELNRYRDIFVDTLSPTVGDIQFTSDTVAPLGTLSGTEVVPGGTYPITVLVGDATGGSIAIWANGALVGTYPVAASSFDIFVPYSQGENTVCAVVTDLVGNKAQDYCENIVVDTQGPLVVFQAPVSSPLLEGSSADVSVYTDAFGRTVVLERKVSGVFGEVAGKVAPGNGIVQFIGAMLSDGLFEFRARVTDAAGNESTAYTTPQIVTVDRTPPTVDILQPAQGAALSPADDASATLGGFQVLLLFNTTDVATWEVETIRCPDASYLGCEAPIKKAPVSVIDSGNGQLSATVTMGNLVSPIEYRRIVLKVRDANGNTRQDQVDVQITAGGCSVAFANLPESGFWNNLLCDVPGQDCGEAQIPIEVTFFGPCGDVTGVQLSIGGTPFETATPTQTGAASFIVPVQHGETLNMEAKLVAAGGPTLFTTGLFVVEADFESPVVTLLSPAVSPVVCGMEQDLNPTAAGCQMALEIQFTDGNLSGGFYSATQLGSSEAIVLAEGDLLASPQTAGLNVTFAEVVSGTLSLEAVDDAGNIGETSVGLIVDITPPGPVSLQAIDPDADVVRRLPMATLRWTAPGDDGQVGQAVSYEVRYSAAPITSQSEFDAACDVSDVLSAALPEAPKEAGLAESYTLAGPDLRAPNTPCLWRVQTQSGKKYYFAVQALDDVGNRSPVSAASGTVTDALTLKYTKVEGGTLTASGIGSFVFSVGDIEGDGYAESIIGGDPSLKGFCVIRGDAQLPAEIQLSEAPSNRVRCVTDSYNSDVGRVGCGVGDVNGDGYRDFLTRVVFNSSGSPITHYRLYLGTSQGFLDPNFAGLFIVNNSKITTSFACAGIGNVNGDKAPNGKPLNDFALSGGESNALYIIPGNIAFTTGSLFTVDLTDFAQRANWNVARVISPDATPGVDFGANTAYVGDILSDGGATAYDDIVVTQFGPPTAAFLLPGGPWSGAKDFVVSFGLTGSQADDAAAVKMVSSTPAICDYGMGDELVSGRDFDGDGIPDIALTQPCYGSFVQNSHYLFFGSALAAAQGESVGIGTVFYINNDVYVGPNGYRIKTNTYSLGGLGDFDGSGPILGTDQDLVFGVFNGLGSSYGYVYVRFNDGGTFNSSTLFPYVDLTITDPYSAASPLFANRVVTPGDVNGDGTADILVSTEGLGYAVVVY